MPTLERTWTNSQNNVPADETTLENQGANILLALKDTFVSAGWTVTQSSNGLTTAASDLWSVYTDVVYGNGAADHSWIVLESPVDYPSTGTQVYFAIDRNAAQNYNCNFYLSTADWTGGTITDIGANPGNRNTWLTSGGFINSGLASLTYHLSYNTTGDVIFYVSQVGVGRVAWGVMINKLAGADASDNYPLYAYIHTLNPTWSQSGLYYNAFGMTNMTGANSKGHWIDGAVLSTQPAYSLNDNFIVYANGGDASGSDINGRFSACPIFVVSTASGKKSFRGRIVDIWMANTGTAYVPNGTVEPSVGSIVLACITSVWLPASVVPVL